MTPIPDSGYDMTPAGMVKIAVGDVLKLRGALHICTRSVESCAVMEPLTKTKRTVTDQVFKTEATFETYGTKQRISQTVEPSMIAERRGQAGVDEYLGLKKGNNMKIETGEHIAIFGDRHIAVFTDERSARLLNVNTLATLTIEREVNEFYLLDKPRLDEAQRKAALDAVVTNFSKLEGRSSEELTNPLTDLERNNTMALRKLKGETKRKARGGLAAEAMADTAAGTSTAAGKPVKPVKVKAPKAEKKAKPVKAKKTGAGNPRLGEVFGFSIGSTINRLGREGLKTADIKKILASKGIEVKTATVAWNVTRAVSGIGVAADLTGEQVKELKALLA